MKNEGGFCEKGRKRRENKVGINNRNGKVLSREATSKKSRRKRDYSG